MPDTFTLIVAPLDPRLSPNDRDVLALIGAHPGVATLDGLCALTPTPAEHVFAAVARLERYGTIRPGVIR